MSAESAIVPIAAAQHDDREDQNITNDAPNKPSTSNALEAEIDNESTRYGLPWNYHFEIEKSILRIQQKKATRVALQFPEGLLFFATAIADVLEEHTGAEMVILGDVTYGACCVDDFAAEALGCDFMIHYGHSCLVSIKDCCLANMLYVFVEIDIDVKHFTDTVKSLVPKDKHVACVSTIQFVSAMRAAVDVLNTEHFEKTIVVPQNRPLSKGELLGCTSPKLATFGDEAKDIDTVLYVGDGRFHLESFMIHNPHIKALQYDPYKKVMTSEGYDHKEMHSIRKGAIERAKAAQSFGIIMGTLGRQGNSRVVDRIRELARRQGKTTTLFLMSEIFPSKLALIKDVDAFIQIACPRLSIDWGYAFDRPLLSPYEAEVCLGATEWREIYPMDHYSKDGGKWAVYTDKSF